MRALIIDPAVVEQIKQLVAFAREHPVSLERVKKMVSGEEQPIGEDPRFCLKVPFGYHCVLSFEEQPLFGLTRHLSVSVEAPGKYPSPEALAELMVPFGFTERFIEDTLRGRPSVGVFGTIYLEKDEEAVNVLEKA